jgi:uncharacterized membrane protein
MSASSVAVGETAPPAASSRLKHKTWLLTTIVIFTQVLGNWALTWGMKHPASGESSLTAWLSTVFSPWVLFGTALLIVWLLSRMTLLSWADLSFVLPVTSIGYVLSAVIGKYFFADQISWQRWLGTIFIVTGTVLVGLTSPRTTPPGNTGRR